MGIYGRLAASIPPSSPHLPPILFKWGVQGSSQIVCCYALLFRQVLAQQRIFREKNVASACAVFSDKLLEVCIIDHMVYTTCKYYRLISSSFWLMANPPNSAGNDSSVHARKVT